MTLIPFHLFRAISDQSAVQVPVYIGGDFPANLRCSLSVVLMLGHHKTYWPSIKSPLGRLVVGGTRT